jgi:hypothetical protein
MREAFFVLLVIAVLLAFTAFRYRRQIAAVYKFWGVLKDARKNIPQPQMNEHAESRTGPLVNCAKCGNWVPESAAIRLGTRVFYCSSSCVEKAASTA